MMERTPLVGVEAEMLKPKKCHCGRCGKLIPESSMRWRYENLEVFRRLLSFRPVHEFCMESNTYELCEDCAESLERWLLREEEED